MKYMLKENILSMLRIKDESERNRQFQMCIDHWHSCGYQVIDTIYNETFSQGLALYQEKDVWMCKFQEGTAPLDWLMVADDYVDSRMLFAYVDVRQMLSLTDAYLTVRDTLAAPHTALTALAEQCTAIRNDFLDFMGRHPEKLKLFPYLPGEARDLARSIMYGKPDAFEELADMLMKPYF